MGWNQQLACFWYVYVIAVLQRVDLKIDPDLLEAVWRMFEVYPTTVGI